MSSQDEETQQREWDRRVDNLAEASAGAREILADLRGELREARKVIKELREEIANAAAVAVQTEINQAVALGLAEYGETVKRAMDKAVERVNGEFDKLFNTLMTGDHRGRGESLQDLAERRNSGER